MSQTFTTLQRDKVSGPVFSTQQQSRKILSAPRIPPAAPQATRPVVPIAPVAAPNVLPTSPAAPSIPEQRLFFALMNQGAPVTSQFGAGGQGVVSLVGNQGASYTVTGTLSGINPTSDPSIRPTLWLIHDLIVPVDLSPADLAALPRGNAGTGNRPGFVFTVDGNPPTYGAGPNTLSVAISPGTFSQGLDGNWHLAGAIEPSSNVSYHPLVILGPGAMADINTAVPSGIAAQILTDLYMRPATVQPTLPRASHFGQRLLAVVQGAQNASPSYLDGSSFTRAAVTLEGLVRASSRLMPTRETCFLAANTRLTQ